MSTSEKTPARKRRSPAGSPGRSTGARTPARSKAAPKRAPKATSQDSDSDKSSKSSTSQAQGSGGKDLAFSLKRDRTRFEWALLAVAVLAIGSVVIGLFRYAGQKSGGPADLSVEVEDTGTQVGGGPQVEVTVRNTGGSGAEHVVTEVKMGDETREVTLTRIPKDDEASALVVFPPGTTGAPEAELLSYNQP
jgi:uncharacterized protein (TIGR02588 family)